MRQWLRKVRVTFPGGFTVNPSNTVETHELRVQFDVSRGISGSPNTFSIKLFNLSPDHRAALGRELDIVQIEAGYVPPEGGGNLGIIAKGRIRDFQHDRDGPDIISTVSCGDGDGAYRRATISKTIPKNTPVPKVVEELYKEMEKQGISKGEWKFPDDIRTIKRPYSMCGSCTRELDVLGRGNGFYWNIQNETMEIIPGDGYLEGAILINAQTGMIGAPTITDNGVKVKALLNPEARPNRQVIVESEVLQMNAEGGTYRISQLDFSGDNREGDFVMDISGESLVGGKVDEGIKK
jgi:hypothetical protein